MGTSNALGTGALLQVAPSNGNITQDVEGSSTALEFVSSIGIEPSTNNPVVTSFETGLVEEFADNANGNAAPLWVINTNPTGMVDPSGIAVAHDGTVAIADRGSPGGAAAPRVLFYSANAQGTPAPVRTLALSAVPTCVALDDNANVYVGYDTAPAASSLTVQEFASGASGAASPIRTISEAAAKYHISGVAVDGSGNLYVSTYTSLDVFAPGSSSPNRSLAPPSGMYWGEISVTAQGAIAAAYGNSQSVGSPNSTSGIEVFAAGSSSGTTISGSATQLGPDVAYTYGSSAGIDADGNVYAGTNGALFWFAPGANGNVAPAASYGSTNSVTATTALSFGP